MTVLAALLLLAPPTALALGMLGLADPKRRRTRGQAPMPSPRRTAAAAVLVLCGGASLALAGPAGTLVWISAAAAGGWALAHGLAAAPDRALARADRALVAGAWRRPTVPTRSLTRCSLPRWWAGVRGSDRTLARGTAALALASTAFCCVVLAGAAWREASAGTAATQRLVALSLLDRIGRTEPTRRAASPCVGAIAADRGGDALRDVLSDRATTFLLPRGPGAAAEGLQRCILGLGGEGAAVTRHGDIDAYEVEVETAARIHAAVTGLLSGDDALAELSAGLDPTAGLVCRRLADAIGPEVDDLVEALRRDRLYAKADDLLLRLPALDRLTEARRAGLPCPA